MNRKYVVGVLGVTFLIVALLMMGFGNDPRSCTVADLREILETRDNVLILDVRAKAEYIGDLGHIQGSTLIPIQELETRIEELKPYKDNEIIVICRTDNRSRAALSILENAGFRKLLFVRGGMMEWNKQLEREE